MIAYEIRGAVEIYLLIFWPIRIRSDISHNMIESELPDFQSLLFLNDSHSGLSGRFPLSLSCLPSLSYLDLSGYELNDYPSFNFSGFPSLFAFKMSGAKLTSVTVICSMSQALVDVDLSTNSISVVDNCTSEQTSLESIDLSWNPITDVKLLPGSILEVHFQGCNLTDVPDAVVALSWHPADGDVQAFSPLLQLDLSFNPHIYLQPVKSI